MMICSRCCCVLCIPVGVGGVGGGGLVEVERPQARRVRLRSCAIVRVVILVQQEEK